MRYQKVYLHSFGYELPPNVVTSDELELRLSPLYEQLHLQPGQLEALTGVRERRYWDEGFAMCQGASQAGQKALEQGGIDPADIGMLIYGGVCRDQLEPATACAVAHELEIGAHAQVYDLSNACLGVVNGMVQVANAIELGQIRAGLVVSCETARQIVDLSIQRMLQHADMETFKKTVATLTGGSGAVAVLLTDGSFAHHEKPHRVVGGMINNDTRQHRLCTWGPDTGMPATCPHVMETDSVGVLQHGVALGVQTYRRFKAELGWGPNQPDKIVCHQVGAAHQRQVLAAIEVPAEKDFTTYAYLGNMGTVSLPMTAAIAAERDFFLPGDRIGFFGIGSGLNCLLLGLEW